MPDIDLNDIHEIHATLYGGLSPHAFEGLAGAILAGHPDEATGILGAYAVPDLVSRELASAYVDALLDLSRSGRGAAGELDGPGVREDLAMQPCQADVAEAALSGNLASAALIAVVHEGYSGAGGLAAATSIAREGAGLDSDLREVRLADVEATGIDAGTAYVARMGKDLAGGRFVREGGAIAFEVSGSGRRIPVGRVAQAWKVVPRA